MGSNRRRNVGPQDDEPVSAEYGGEPALKWRSLERMHHAAVAAKAVMWHTTWLRAERQEGGAKQEGRPAGEVNAGRSQSPNSTDHGETSRAVEKCVRAKDALGKWGRKVDS